MPQTQQTIDALEAQVAEQRRQLERLEAELNEARANHADALGVPARSLRRAAARRASKRRAQARTLKADARTSILEFLDKHPGSTAGEVAKGLDLNRSTVSSRLAQLAKLGQIRKAERGYAPR
jgi:DNA-binding IclR family transcriptional regulator